MSINNYWKITQNDVYVRVFDEILDELDETVVGKELATNYKSLCLESRYLITRIYLRTRKWIRIDDFQKYLPLKSLNSIVLPELIREKWLEDKPRLEDVIGEIATTAELQNICKELGIKLPVSKKTDSNKITEKATLVKKLRELEVQQSLFNSCKVATSVNKYVQTNSYRLSDERRRFLHKLETIFLFPIGPDATLESLYLTHMGKWSFLKYEYYSQKERPIFPNFEACDAYYEASRLCSPINMLLQRGSGIKINSSSVIISSVLEDKNLEKISANFDNALNSEFKEAAYTYARGIYDISQLFMKKHDFIAEYRYIQKYLDQNVHHSKRGNCLIRKLLLEIRFLKQINTKGESSWLVSAINTYYDAIDTVNPIERLDLDRKASKLLLGIKNTGLQSALSFIPKNEDIFTNIPQNTIIKRANISSIPAKKRELLDSTPTTAHLDGHNSIGMQDTNSGSNKRVLYDEGLNVEQFALTHYKNSGFQGGHFENSVMLTLIWFISYDLLFSNRESFRCAYQSQPMRVQQLFTANMCELKSRFDSSNALRYLDENRKMLLGLGPPRPTVGSINWYISEDVLRDVITGLNTKLEPILSRICQNYRIYSSGFPDLTLILVDDKDAAPRIKFVEVKSENDTVSDNQQLWMQFLLDIGCDVEICKVTSKNKPAQSKKRNHA